MIGIVEERLFIFLGDAVQSVRHIGRHIVVFDVFGRALLGNVDKVGDDRLERRPFERVADRLVSLVGFQDGADVGDQGRVVREFVLHGVGVVDDREDPVLLENVHQSDVFIVSEHSDVAK